MVEAAGIEPASKEEHNTMSTCLSRLRFSPAFTDGQVVRDIPSLISRRNAEGKCFRRQPLEYEGLSE